MHNIRIKIHQPVSDSEFDGMWRLNHDVFSVELGQHPVHEDGLLIDKFHYKNIYWTASAGEHVVGMLAAHAQPPYSFEDKFKISVMDLSGGTPAAEIRLLCVKPAFRKTSIAARLIFALVNEFRDSNIDFAVISGINTQQDLYKHIGFSVCGQAVKDGNAVFYPMLGKREILLEKLKDIIQRYENLRKD